MALNPIDLQVVINQITEVSKRKSEEINKKKKIEIDKQILREKEKSNDRVDLVNSKENEIQLVNKEINLNKKSKKKIVNEADKKPKNQLQEHNKGIFLNIKE